MSLAIEVANADFTFGTPTNLGPTVNSSTLDAGPSISADGLTLFFDSERPGGMGGQDIWITERQTTRQMTELVWGTPINLGPTVNSAADEFYPEISADGLSLYFADGLWSWDVNPRPGGFGQADIWVTTRESTDDDWGTPVNLGPTINSSAYECDPSISIDGLSLYFGSNRPGGSGGNDLWVTTRPTVSDPWGPPMNLGSTVNSSDHDVEPSLSSDGLVLFFMSTRSGGVGNYDLWVTMRASTDDDWEPPVNLGPTVNSSVIDVSPFIQADGSTLLFMSERIGGYGTSDLRDLWQVSIDPVVDLNRDGIVDSADMCIMVDHWGTDEPLCDIGPMPWGDGIVDVQDLIVLAEHLFEGIPPDELEEVNVDEEDAGSQVELEQGRILVVTLESNPTTGYRWEQVETQESILQQMGEAEFKPSQTSGPPLVGAGGWEIFRFKAISAGEMTLQLVYHRPWEEGVEPLKTFSLQVVVR